MTKPAAVRPGRRPRAPGARAPHLRGLLVLGCLAGAVTLAAFAGPAIAQDEAPVTAEPPNPLLSFTLSQGLRIDQNRDLEPGEDDLEARLSTGLSFALSTRTRISELSLAGRSGLSLPLASDEDEGPGLDGAQVDLNYSRAVPTGSLVVSGTVRRDEVGFLRDLGDFVGEDGGLDLPEDLADLQGEATRTAFSLASTLTLRDQARFGIILSTGINSFSYDDVSSDDLVDSRSLDLGLGLRFDLSEVATLRPTLRASRVDEAGSDPRTRLGLDLSGSLERPDGSITALLAFDEVEDGTRTRLSFGRDIERPLGTYAGSFGLTRAASGNLSLNGSLSISRALPRGVLSLSLDQTAGLDDDGEEVATSLSARLSRELTPRTSLGFETLYGSVRNLETDESVQSAEIGITLNQSITPAWSLVLDLRHRRREETAEPAAQGNSVSLSLSRTFERGL